MSDNKFRFNGAEHLMTIATIVDFMILGGSLVLLRALYS